MTNEEALDRLRTIVDECIGMQPVLGWDELLTLVETKLREDFRRSFNLAEALNDAYKATLPAGTIRASHLERICERRGVRDALSSAEDSSGPTEGT